MFFKINNSFFLDEEDIGNLVCVKINQNYYNSIDVYDNCLVIDAIYTDSNIRPSQIVFLKESGFILKLNMNYNSSIEVQNSNMSKLGTDGEPIYNEAGKVMKGPNYFKPDLSKFVK